MLEGTLSEEDQGAMALHLEKCEPCQERFEQLVREVDCFSEAARELGGERRTQDTALEQVIQALHAKGSGLKDGGELSDEATDGEPASSEDLSLDFLDPSDDPDHLGRLGPYEVIEVVGRGGMGVVLKGHDDRLNRVVAIKVLHPRLAINATARKRFRRESRAAAAVSHDHVVTIHAVEEVDGLPILVMEYVEGVSLQQRIKENGPLMLEEILRVGMQAASGLAAAHAQGIIHRDVKPSNILLENGVERVKLTDFGLARAVDDVHLTKSGVLAGTPEYMSPEQAHAEPVDGRSDLFSLGSVLYACCTGRSPFRADSTMAALRRVCEDTPRPIREINPEIPDWLVEIIDRLLAKDREERFESASEVAELLGGHLAHLQHPTDVPQPARLKPSATAGPSRPNRFLRRRWIAAAAAALVVLVAGMGVTEGTGLTRVVATAIELWTPHGILIIETDDPDIEIAISGDGEEVIFTGAGVRKITVPIDVLFEVKGKKDGNTVFRDVVRITRNGERVTRVRVAPPKLDTVILEIGESEKAVEVSVSEDKEITITDPNDGQEIRVTVERGKQTLTLRKAGFDTQTTKFNLESKNGRRVCVTFVPKRQPLTTAQLSEKLSPTLNGSNDVDPFGLAEKEGWQLVLRGLRQEVDGGSRKHWFHYKLLALLAYLDAELYEEYCNDHLDHKDFPYLETGEPPGTFATRSAQAALLLPGIELARIEPLVDLSESTVYGAHFVRAMYEYRTGRFDSAVQHLEESRKLFKRGGTEWIEACHTHFLYWLAMTHHKLGNGDEATKAYQTAEIRFRQSTVPAHPEVDGVPPWHDWLQAAVIRREARAVLGLGADHGGHEPTPPRDADKAKEPLTTAELFAKLSAEEQAALEGLSRYRTNILLIDRSPAKPALVGDFQHYSGIHRQLQHLKVLTNMHYLDLRKCQLSDTDLEHLADLDELQYLFLGRNPVTDAGLEHVKRLTNLQILRLENTQVSAAGVMELQKALPECLIEWPSRVPREPPSSAKMTADENAAIAQLCLLGGEIHPIDRGAARPALLCSFYRKRNLTNHLQPLSVLTNMCLLHLEHCDVTDADLTHLATLRGLHYLTLDRNNVTDAGLKHLASLTELRILRLVESQVTDAGLKHLRGLVKLQRLKLWDMPIDGTGLVHLKELGALRGLQLGKTRINDASLEHINGLTGLRALMMDFTPVSDAGLKHLSGLTNLQGLGLNDTQVTDAGLVHLRGLTNLQTLRLNNTRVTDAGLEQVRGLTNLEVLKLNDTQVTDAGLEHLKGLTSLQTLELDDTRVTATGVTDLRKALPDCQIRWPIYDVPEGGVDELLQFIENLKQFRPATPQERAEYQSKAQAALKLAAQRILAQDKDPWSKPCQTALRALLEIRITDIPQTDRQQQGETVEFVKTFLKAKLERQLESLDVDLARSAAQALETCRNLELAAQAYDQFADLIAESGNKEFSKTVKEMKDAAKRLSNAER